MGLISRVYTFVNGTPADATEVNAEFDTIHTVVNGNIDNANISASAAIAATKVAEIPPARVLDHADTDAEYLTGTTPGTTASLSRPSTLEGELERLRYRLQANNKHLFVQYMDASAAVQSLGWVEPSSSGPNLLPNSGFEVKSSATATDAPDAWTKVGTPDGLTIVTTSEVAFGADKRSLLIDGRVGATGDGVSYTLKGLKSLTKYLIGIAYVRVKGTVRLSTTGGVAAAAYQDLVLTSASGTTATYMQGVVSTNATPDDLVVTLDCAANDTEYRVYHVWAYEMAERARFDIPSLPMQTATDNTASSGMTGWTGTGNAWRTDTLSTLSLSQYVPCLGYRLVYEVSVPIRSADASNEGIQAYLAIQRNVDGGGASTVVGPEFVELDNAGSNAQVGHTFNMRYVLENPTPGSTYAMTALLGAWDEADLADVIVAPAINTVQTVATARLIMERL